MDDMDLMIQEKIKKKEKTDIMLAYILIVILVGCILFVVYLKFIKNSNNNNNNNSNNNSEEYIVERITLSSIADSITNSLNDKYSGITTSSDESSINVIYGDLLYNIKLINNELEFNIDNDNKELSEDIYKNIITSVCNYYNDDADGCKNASDNVIYGNDTNGIRFVNNIIYISVTNGITPIDSDIDSDSNVQDIINDIDNTDYELTMNDITINNVKINAGDVNITVSGNISSEGNITVKLYNSESELLEEKSVTSSDNFSITFDYNDKLNIDSIKKYSISIE